MMVFEHLVDYRPCGFHCILPREERAITDHGVAQQSLVGSLRTYLFFAEEELALLPDELFAGRFDAGSQRERGVG
jgi:hypothetical protein